MPKTLPQNILSKDQLATVQATLSKFFGTEGAAALLPQLELLDLGKGETIIEENTEAEDMFIVLSGSLEAFVMQDGQAIQVGTIVPGESVGEMALIGQSTRSATIKARRNSLLLRIERTLFNRLAKESSALAYHLSKVIIDRLNKSNKNEHVRRKKSKFIAVFSLNSTLSEKDLTDEIQEYWGNECLIHVLTEKEHSALTHEVFSLIINDLEDNDYVFLLAGADEDWNSRISRNCDKRVFIGKEADKASMDLFIKEHGKQDGQDELILTYEQDLPTYVDQWFKYFTPNRVFRKRNRHEPDEHRIARIICEEQICLVFGGGGAHGLANVGVIKSLWEHSIPIDIVGGTSVGSLFSGALAQDWSYRNIYQNVKKDISERNPLNDYRIPLVSLLKGKKMEKVLKKHFDLDIENSWKNFFCIASNLSTSSQEIIQEGSMKDAIAASISIPGILPPKLYRKGLMIDGGVLNNLPADKMEDLYNGHIISVDVVSSKIHVIENHYQITNRQFFRNKISGNHKNYVPGIMNTIMKATTLASLTKADEKEAISQYFIKPRIKKGFLEWSAMDDFVKEGYNTTNFILDSHDFKKDLNLPQKHGTHDYI